MIESRSDHAVVQLGDNSFWITGKGGTDSIEVGAARVVQNPGLFSGGHRNGNGESVSLNTTEIYIPGKGGFVPGPTLPFPRENHCMVKINATHFIFTGGDAILGVSQCILIEGIF